MSTSRICRYRLNSAASRSATILLSTPGSILFLSYAESNYNNRCQSLLTAWNCSFSLAVVNGDSLINNP